MLCLCKMPEGIIISTMSLLRYYMINFLKLTVTLCFIGLLYIGEGPTFKKAYANQVNPLMKCLGQEELKIHRAKSTGPAYYLNQVFVNELATIYGLTLRPSVLADVCQKRLFSPSVNLLRILLLDGKKAFVIPKEASEGGVAALTTSSLESFIEETPHVFFSYLSKLQALAPSAACLEKEIPEIAYFMERYKWLEDTMGTRKLISEKNKVNAIFRKLLRFDSIIKKCKKAKK